MAIEYLASINLNKNELQNARLHYASTLPSNPVEGQIFYDSDDNQAKIYTAVTSGVDSGWQSLVFENANDIFTGLSAVTPATGDSFLTLDQDGNVEQKTTVDALATLFAGAGLTASNGVIATTNDQNTSGTAAIATAITVADESSDTTCFPLFATAATGDLGAKSGSNLTFNSSTGIVTATGFAGALTGNVTGNASGTALTVTQAAQTAITSVGDLTALVVDTVSINGNAITSTADSLFAITAKAGQALGLESMRIDAGAVTGLSSVTSTGFTGELTGNASTATALASSRNLQVALATTTAQAFTGAANATSIGISGVLASANLDADTAHLDVAQTFGATKTFGTTNKLQFRDANSYIHSNDANDLEVVAATITLDASSDIQLEGDTTVTGNFSVSGTLNVDGQTTTIDSTTVAIADSMLKLAKDQAADEDLVDFGFYGQYGVSDVAKFAGVFRDGSVAGDPFTFFDSLQAEPGATVNTSGTGYDLADLSAGKIVSADGFTGNLTGNVTGNASGTAATVTGAAQTAITSVGTLTALTVDNLGINGNTITANSGALNLIPATGSAIVLDSTINVDAGVVTGATSITSTAFVGALTGNASGSAATVTTAAQTAITSLGTLTTLTVDNVIINGSTIGHTGDTDLITVASGIVTVAGEVSLTTLDIGGTNVTSTAAELNMLDAGTAGSSVALVDADSIIIGDASASNATKKVLLSDISTYLRGEEASATAYAADIDTDTTGHTADGTNAKLIEVTHSLNSLDVNVTVVKKSTGATVYMDVLRTHVNKITLERSDANWSGTADYRVLVTKIG
tara:strand:+ start:3434 stop:5854 length:2421 start_codon:yes stop_codon:yes gene_type:complete